MALGSTRLIPVAGFKSVCSLDHYWVRFCKLTKPNKTKKIMLDLDSNRQNKPDSDSLRWKDLSHGFI